MNGSCSMEPTLRTSAILTHKDSTEVSVESTVSVRDRSLLEELLSEKKQQNKMEHRVYSFLYLYILETLTTAVVT